MTPAPAPDCIEGAAVVKHKTTGLRYIVRADEVVWQAPIELNPKDAGHVRFYEGKLNHPDLGNLKWEIFETVSGEIELNFSSKEDFYIGDEGLKRLRQHVEHKVIENFRINPRSQFKKNEVTEATNATVAEMCNWFHENYENLVESHAYKNWTGVDRAFFNMRDAFGILEEHFINTPGYLIVEAVTAIEASGFFQWISKDFGRIPAEPAPDIPNQASHFAFAVNDAGQIDLATDSGLPTDEDRNTRELRQQLVEALDEFIEKLTGSNAHPEISEYATRYRKAAVADPLSVDILYAKGNWFENAIRRVKQDIAAGEAPTLTPDIGATLDMSLSLHGLIIASTARGQELIRLAEEYAAANIDNQAYQAAAQPLIEAVGQSTNIFTAETINFVSQANSEIEEGEHPQRSSHVGRATLSNLLVTIGKIVLGETKKIIASGVRQGLTTLVATSVFAGVTAVGHETLRFFLDNISVFHALSLAARDTFLWLGHLLHWITPLL